MKVNDDLVVMWTFRPKSVHFQVTSISKIIMKNILKRSQKLLN